MQFTTEERAFLEHHKMPDSRVLDASGLMGLSLAELRKLMVNEEFTIAIGFSQCAKDIAHRMTFKDGRCFQCNSGNLGHSNNYRRAGFVYICISDSKRLIKIGSSNSLDARVEKLKGSRYGEANDWRLLRSWQFEKVGPVEFAVQKALENYKVHGVYGGHGRNGGCDELYACTAEKAIEELNRAASAVGTKRHAGPLTHSIPSTTIKAVPRKHVEFRAGDKVRNSKALHLGDGVVVRDSTTQFVVVQFPNGNEKEFPLPSPQLEKL